MPVNGKLHLQNTAMLFGQQGILLSDFVERDIWKFVHI